MKKVLIIFFLFTFVLQSTSRLWIAVSFYMQRDYIAKNLCINRFDMIPLCKGKCYLTQQLKENEKREQNLPDVKHKDVQLFFQNNIHVYIDKAISSEREHFTLDKENFLSSDLIFSVFHPPKAA